MAERPTCQRRGVSIHSLRYLLTGRELEYPLHVRLEFGEYVQTHERHGNRMTDRTVGAICLGPNGNSQGGHYFMRLTTGARITRDRWTDLPMPREVIHWVSEMGRQQGMPTTLTFADRHGQELEDRLVEVPDDDSTQEAYDPHYDDDSDHTGEDDLSYDTSDDEDDNDDDNDDDPHAPVPLPIDGGSNDDDNDDDSHVPDPLPNGHDDGNAFAPDPPILDNDPVIFGAAFPPFESNEDEHTNNPMSTGVGEASVDADAADIINVDDTEESMGEENPNNTGVDEDAVPMVETMMDDEESAGEDTTPITESCKFEQAVTDGKSRALGSVDQRPPCRQAKKVKDPNFDYLNLILEDMDHHTAFAILMEQDSEEILSFLTEQMTAKRGLKQFGTAGAEAIMNELKQIVYRKVMEGRKSGELTTAQKKAALKYLMFLKQKRCGKIKGRGCADGRKQRLYKSKDETSSPTITTEALFITCLVDAIENRYLATLTEFRQPLQVQSHLEMPGILVQLGHIQCT